MVVGRGWWVQVVGRGCGWVWVKVVSVGND